MPQIAPPPHRNTSTVESEGAITRIRGLTVAVEAAGKPSAAANAVTKPAKPAVASAKSRDGTWFGRLPANTLGIAGSAIGQYGYETKRDGAIRGDFS